MTSQGKRKIEELDMIKGLVILLVIFVHLGEMTGLIGACIKQTTWIFSTGIIFMAICFLCSGYVYSVKGTVLQDIIRRARQLIVPYYLIGAVFLAVYFLRFVVMESKPLIWYLDRALTFLAGLNNWNIRLGKAVNNPMEYAFVPFWFVAELFAAFCIFIPIRRITEGKKRIITVIWIAVLCVAAMLFNKFDIQHTLETTYWTNVPYFFVLINIFAIAMLLLTGSLLRNVNFLEKDSIKPAFTCIKTVISLIVVIAYYVTDKDTDYALQYGKWGPYGCLSIILSTIVSVCFFYLLFRVFSYAKRIVLVKKILCFVGENSLVILLLHYGIAETITWIGGFWRDYFENPFMPDEFSAVNCLITYTGTLMVLSALFFVNEIWVKKHKSR